MPAEWRDGLLAGNVPDDAVLTLGVPLTAALVAQIIAPWASAYVTTSSQLEKANERTVQAIEIVRQCEALANSARK